MEFICTATRTPQIVSDPAAPAPVRFAAAELARYLGLAFGGEIPVAAAPAADAPVIQVACVPDETLTDEGYILAAETAGKFSIRGGGPAGAVYGVYEFLRRYAGCRFSGYAPDGEHVPRLERLAIPMGAVRMRPELWYRGLQFSTSPSELEWILKRVDWMAKNGMNYVLIHLQPELPLDDVATFDPETGRVVARNENRFTNTWFRRHMLPAIMQRGLKVDMNHHNLFYWLPPEKYFAEHPEWYAQGADGARSRMPAQLCLCTSNRAVVAELIKNVLQYLRENPETRIVGVIPEDGIGMCRCPACRRLDADPGDADKPFNSHRQPEAENRGKSRRYALLLNEVARAVGREFPGVKVGGAAYVDLQWPPRGVQYEKNIVIWMAIYWRCAVHELAPDACRMNRFFLDILDQWRRTQPCELILYEYYMGMNAQKGLPYPMADVIIREWPRLKKMGIGGATVQSREGDHQVYALNYQAFARMGWAARVDYPALRDEFLAGMFGSLADAVRPVYEHFDRRVKSVEAQGSDSPFLQPVPPAIGCYLPNSRNIAFLLEGLDVPAALARIENAMRQASLAREQRQAEDFLNALRYWNMAVELCRAAQAVDAAEARGDAAAAQNLAGRTLAQWEPELRRVAGLPVRGWIRTASQFWEKQSSWGSLPWFRARGAGK